MAHTIHDIGVASQIGSYSDAIEAKPNLRWLMTSGTPGLTVNGDGLPKDITGQAELAWQHIISILGKAGMTVTDIVKVTKYLRERTILQATRKFARVISVRRARRRCCWSSHNSSGPRSSSRSKL